MVVAFMLTRPGSRPRSAATHACMAGAGFALNVLRLDASYMMATAQNSPLDQTLRFSLTFDMEGLKDIFGRR